MPLTQTTWFRRKATDQFSNIFYSNTLKIEVVSLNWENINYVREHDVLVSGQTDWKVIDNLPIGQKLQTTTYLDGLGRPLEKISRETATPSQPNSLWGDVVQFSQYDALGKEPKQYLPYTTTTESGKYKSTQVTEQAQYYNAVYNETYPYSQVIFDNTPLGRVTNVKSPGTSWAAGDGNKEDYDLNNANENVQNFTIGYSQTDIPVSLGAYPANALLTSKHTDEEGHNVIEYTNTLGQVILTKTQIAGNPSVAHDGWICVYSVYDDFGLLRYRLQPEAVKYLDENSWSFGGTSGQQVLNELCFRYNYDDKGRNIFKKAPGAKELKMIYDQRDRVVFMQDGNQAAKSTPEWTANLYDELDRPTITTLYTTGKTVSQLQADIDNSMTVSTVDIVNPFQVVSEIVLNSVEVGNYAAQNSIELLDGFESLTNGDFTAEIYAGAGKSYTVTAAVYKNPITAADLNNSAKNTIVKYLFYDNYSYAGARLFDNNFSNTTAYSNSEPDVIPIAASKRTTGFPTGSMARVLGTNTFLTSSEYYDDKGRHIQTIEDNFKSGKDVTTMQYQWDGRLLSTQTKHTTTNSGYSNFSILTKNVYDKIGRVISLQKKYGSNDFKTIASYDLDDMGRLKTKHLDPGYTGSGKDELESLDYTYNIHNNITGINKDYALKTPGKYDKWGNFFGLYLGYDKTENIFSNAKLDGHVTGLLWNTMGDDAQRKYDFTYDAAGRLTKADFKEYTPPSGGAGGGWDNAKMDFTVGGSGTNNSIQYDLNGNLQTMFQKGVVAGNNTPLTVDALAYTYASYSNKLIKVTDNGNAGSANGKLGDFADGSNNSTDDYVYDDNGNLVIDLNKNAKDLANVSGANGIRYNFLDKPEEIHISGKGTIQIVYDADGNKLQKKYTPENTTNTITTTYVNEFVYTGDALQYINFEEGRIRLVTPVSLNNGFDGLTIDGNMDLPNAKRGAYDFFIRDYQQNVRMILTEETHNGSNDCTMESSRSANEEPVFGQSGTNNEVTQTRTTKPSGWQSNTSNSVSKLSALGKKAGPNVLLKVMAGDEISATTQYYYQNNVTNGTGNNLTTDILTSLVQSILGSSSTGLAKGNSTSISDQLNVNASFNNITAPDASNPNGTNPKAYLTIVFFDERFNFVSEGSTALRVSTQGDGAAPLVLPNIRSPKNGYAYIYLSNESNEPVYFDNFTVGDNRGRIIEEDHYYAFGLKIAGISSKKLPDVNEGNIDNKNLYNDKEFFDDADLDWYDYGYRNYDPQIGRFPQLDPLTDEFPELTPYQYASDEPIANVDMDGLEKELCTVAKLTVKIQSATLEKIATSTAKKAIEKFAEEVFQQSVKRLPSFLGILARFGGTFAAVLIPTDAGVKPTHNDELYGMPGHPGWKEPILYPIPSSNPSGPPDVNDEPENNENHEQYVLEATKTGLYPVLEWGKKNPVGKVKLKAGDVYKYGTTVNPKTRYSQIALRRMHLEKRPQAIGSKIYVLAREGLQLIKYFWSHGKLPPGNKMFK